MNQYGRYGMGGIPDVVKNLVIINVIVYVATMFYPQFYDPLAMHFIKNSRFEPWQIVTHMFMHGGTWHIFFNMFALWMFGSQLERIWGPGRFLVFYLITGLGAIGLHTAVSYWEFMSLTSHFSHADVVDILNTQHREFLQNRVSERIWTLYHAPIVGASGAIYGLLVAFGMLFPNTPLMLIFLPIPIKAKYFIPILMVMELFLGVGNYAWDNIAHFAHLGGALFGFILVMIWKKDRNSFY